MKTFFHVFFTSYGHGEFRGQGGGGCGWAGGEDGDIGLRCGLQSMLRPIF